MVEQNEIPEWLRGLSEDDFQFIRRFILVSGSLKDLAEQYDVSYPTIRLRLNRLIEKIQALEEKPKTPFHRTVKLLVLDGRLDVSAARQLIKSFEQSEKNNGKQQED